tara:strand:+ start:382 stop:708 length:327 start_codon:yes stop_codon:yes gene_type:complete
MATRYHNLDGSVAKTIQLLPPGSRVGSINSITITNTALTREAVVSLYIQDDVTGASKSTFYLLKRVSVPAGVSLLLDNPSMLNFDSLEYGLYGKVNDTDEDVDFLISS